MNIPFSPPDITDLEINEMISALKSGWITTGPKTKLFEKKIAEYCGTSRAVCLSSATAALELMLRLLGIGADDEVITSAYTYTASASVIYHVGARIILVDVAPGSFQMDYEKLADAITERTKAIIPVDIGGVMCDYDAIYEAVESKKNLYHPSDNEYQRLFGRPIIVADAAHSFGATYHGLKSGAVADFSCFSFHAVKNLTAAEGGAIVWKSHPEIDDEKLYRWFMLYSLHGQSKDALTKMKLGAWEYDIVYPAYKCNMTDLAAAMGLVQLQRFDGLSKRRKHIIREYDKVLLPLGIDRLSHFGDGFEGNGHLYLIRIPGITEIKRNEIIVKMAEAGIACNVHFKPLPMHTAYMNLGFSIVDYPNAYYQYANEITLPLHTLLTDDEVAYVAQTMREILEGERRENKISSHSIEFVRVYDGDTENITIIYNLYKECGERMFLDDGLLHWADPLPMSIIREECLTKETYIVFEKTKNTPLAYFIMTERPSPYYDVEPHSLYLDRIAVSPSYWRKGIGRLCFNYALTEAKKRECVFVRAIVYEKDKRALEFFRSLHFRTIYKRPTKNFLVLCQEMKICFGVS